MQKRFENAQTFGVEQRRDRQMLLGDVERVSQVGDGVRLLEPIELDELRPMAMNERVERESIAPACREILHVDVAIAYKIQVS